MTGLEWFVWYYFLPLVGILFLATTLPVCVVAANRAVLQWLRKEER